VDLYVTLSEFAKGKLCEAGISAGRVVVQPNFLPDPASPGGCPAAGHGALFVGRASPEKGLLALVEAWRGIEYPLTVIGSGPELQRAQAASPPQVTFTGEIPHDAVLDQMRRSAMLVMPSEWYEGLPMVLIEAMALARPVVSSDLGPRREVVVHGKTGLLYHPGDASDLRDKVRALIADPAQCVRMGAAARQRYLELYTAERHCETLVGIYRRALRIAEERKAAVVLREESEKCVG
jgi:glycosyltransferase involved in cell wall biosynthesis